MALDGNRARSEAPRASSSSSNSSITSHREQTFIGILFFYVHTEHIQNIF